MPGPPGRSGIKGQKGDEGNILEKNSVFNLPLPSCHCYIHTYFVFIIISFIPPVIIKFFSTWL